MKIQLKQAIQNSNFKPKTYKKLDYIIKNYPQIKNNQINYLIAGSWAIEILSNQKIKHDDIDFIILKKQPIYTDDATITEEKCDGPIPLSKKYFLENHIISKYKNKNIIIPTINLQICLKICGQLEDKLPNRAEKQLKLLLENYNLKEKKRAKYEIKYILKNILPEDLDFNKLTKDFIFSINLYKKNKTQSIKEFRKLHKITIKSLNKEFKKL